MKGRRSAISSHRRHLSWPTDEDQLTTTEQEQREGQHGLVVLAKVLLEERSLTDNCGRSLHNCGAEPTHEPLQLPIQLPHRLADAATESRSVEARSRPGTDSTRHERLALITCRRRQGLHRHFSHDVKDRTRPGFEADRAAAGQSPQQNRDQNRDQSRDRKSLTCSSERIDQSQNFTLAKKLSAVNESTVTVTPLCGVDSPLPIE